MTKVLVAYASRNGSTGGIAEALGEAVARTGVDVDVARVTDVHDIRRYDAVIVGSAVYFDRWIRNSVRFLKRHRDELSGRPVWLFQSGPLDHSAESRGQALPSRVAAVASRIGVRGCVTFGGRLDENTNGLVARSMVKNGKGGDFRNFGRIEAWGRDVAAELAGLMARSERSVPAE